MDSCYGAVSSYLGITGGYSIADVLKQNDKIDSALISTSATKYKDNFDVLVSVTGTSENGSDRYPHLDEALEACKGAYKYTIIDAPRLPDQTMRLLVNASKSRSIGFSGQCKRHQNCQNHAFCAGEFHISPDKIFPVCKQVR